MTVTTKEHKGNLISRFIITLRSGRLLVPGIGLLVCMLLVSMKPTTDTGLINTGSSVRNGITATTTVTKRPFNMPIEGEKYKIFQPIYDMKDLEPRLFSSAQDFLSSYTKRVGWVNTMIQNPPSEADEEYAKLMYLEMIKSIVSATVFGKTEKTVHPGLNKPKLRLKPLDSTLRALGNDWTYVGDTSKCRQYQSSP